MTTQTTRPPKHLVRAYVERRTHPEQDKPPESIEDIRRELGWELLKNNDDITGDES